MHNPFPFGMHCTYYSTVAYFGREILCTIIKCHLFSCQNSLLIFKVISFVMTIQNSLIENFSWLSTSKAKTHKQWFLWFTWIPRVNVYLILSQNCLHPLYYVIKDQFCSWSHNFSTLIKNGTEGSKTHYLPVGTKL